MIDATPSISPPLDPGFRPAALWHREYDGLVQKVGGESLVISLQRSNGNVSTFSLQMLPPTQEYAGLNSFCVEKLLKFLLWQKGGYRITIAGNPELASHLAEAYRPGGSRAFDAEFMGLRVYGKPFEIVSVPFGDAPAQQESASPLGRHRRGCRIGFDLGGSDRKCAAMIDGEVVFSEEVVWNPYFEQNPAYHFNGIQDSLRRAAAHLPRVDAIGGSAAGVYVDNEVRVASIFRGVSSDTFDREVRPMFQRISSAWNHIPFVVVNDGEVAALAGSMALDDNAVLGISMGTSQAAGYVTPDGSITDWLDELAFAPIDYASNSAVDEWSRDGGVGAQYLSQQAVARLLPLAGISVDEKLTFAERLVITQQLMAKGDERALKIYQTLGAYFGYAVAHYAGFYELRHVLTMGRVTTGEGGSVILDVAREVLNRDFPDLAARVQLHLPGEHEKRGGQAAAAATLPALDGKQL